MSYEDVSALAEVLAKFDKGKEIASKRFEEKSATDHMTGLFNRRTFENRGGDFMAELYGQPERQDQLRSVAIIFADIDHFKTVNDTYGHEPGDEVIKGVAQVLKDGVRPGDLAVRLGGEELLAILRNMTLEQAIAKAEELRKKIESLSFTDWSKDFKVTVSLGVALAERGKEQKKLGELLHDADAAMYDAKNSGRNQVKVYEKGVTPEKPKKEDKRIQGETASPISE